MSFDNTILENVAGLPAGSVIKAMPSMTLAFELFEDGLVEGRFCKFAAGQVDNLDSSATPVLAGVVTRKITGEIGSGVYSTTGNNIDSVAEVCNFGFVTVAVTDAATPAKYDQVYTVNAATADAGKGTDDSGELIVPGAIFWEEKEAGVWLVRIMMGSEVSTSYVSSPSTLELSYVDGADGTAVLSVQAKSSDGTDYAENVLTRAWVGTADDFGVDAITGVTVDTGTSKEVVTSNAELLVISDATGLIELGLDNNGAGTIYAWVEIAGNIYPSGAIVITA